MNKEIYMRMVYGELRFAKGSNAGAELSCFLSLLVLKSGSPPASAVFASQLLAQKDRRPYSQ